MKGTIKAAITPYRSLPCRHPFASAGSIIPPKREACSPPPAVILGRGQKGSGMRADYVIVGAGSAGCALAYRLAEAGRSVIVVEAGGSDAGPFIQMPGALSFPMNMPRYDWGLRTEPEPHLGGRRLVVPRGRVIGGSSSINGMVWVRGHARDFDHWAQAGARGWAWRDVLPYYRRLEAWDGKGQGGDADWRGTDGPVRVSRGPRANPLFDIFVQAAAEAGYGITGDYNGHRQEGIGPADQTVHGGRRWSAARAYLGPAIRRFNCRLVRGEVARVRFEGRRALGVELAGGDVLSARREVILSASAINSPKLLMLSGVGPAAALADLGIEVVADRPGVGQNLQDHLEVYMQIASRQPVTLYRYWNLAGKAYVGLRWLLSRTGPGASNQIETLGFLRSRAGVDYPDIQFHFMPIAMRYDGQIPPQGHGFQAHVARCALPRGAVSRSPRPTPRRHPRSFSTTWPTPPTGRFSVAASGFCARSSRSRPSRLTPARRSSPEPRPGVTMRSTLSCATMPRAPTTPVGPAGWGLRTIPAPWSTQKRG